MNFHRIGLIVVLGLGNAVAALAGDFVLHRVDVAPGALPQNVDLDHAKQVFGASVLGKNGESRQDIDDNYALISNDATIPYPLSKGSSDLDVTFLNTAAINRVNVVNLKVRGTAQVLISELAGGSGNTWRPVSKPVKLDASGVTPIHFGTTTARAIRVLVRASNKGQMGGIEAFGGQTIYSVVAVEGQTLPIQREPTVREVTNQLSAASTITNSRVTHTLGATPAEDPDRMIDGDADTMLRFEGGGPYLAIIDMSLLEPIRRVSFLTSPHVQNIKMVPLASLDDGQLASALEILAPELAGGGAIDNLSLRLLPLVLGQRQRNSLGDMPETVVLPGNYFARENAVNANIGGGNYTGVIDMETTPMQYLVLRVYPSGGGPVALNEVNAYTDPRRRRYGAEPDTRADSSGGYLDSLSRTNRVPRIPSIPPVPPPPISN